jgi:hypothetical protein
MRSVAIAIAFTFSVAVPGLSEERTVTFTAPKIVNGGEDPGAAHAREAPAEMPVPRHLRFGKHPPVLPPGLGDVNPHFVESGFYIEAFWAVDVGKMNGYFIRGHFHPKDLATGYEAQHFGDASELHGLFVRAVDGRPFGLKSLRYRVTTNRELRRNESILGFTNYSAYVLVASSFTPKGSVRGQFTPFWAGPPIGNGTSLPWSTLYIRGFEYVTQAFIASSASVDFDDIVLELR